MGGQHRHFPWRSEQDCPELPLCLFDVPTTIGSGLSLSGIIGMVAGHPNAHTVNLVRWGRKGLQDRDFAALLTAISNGSRSSRSVTLV